MYVCMYVCMYIYIYIYVCVYILYIHIHMHTVYVRRHINVRVQIYVAAMGFLNFVNRNSTWQNWPLARVFTSGRPSPNHASFKSSKSDNASKVAANVVSQFANLPHQHTVGT